MTAVTLPAWRYRHNITAAALPPRHYRCSITATALPPEQFYHGIAAKKYEKLGGMYDSGEMSEPSEAQQQKAIAIFKAHGLEATIGG